MKLIVDRFESEYVICEDQNTFELINLDRSYFPSYIAEGDMVEFVDGEIIQLDNSKKKEEIEEKMEDLWK